MSVTSGLVAVAGGFSQSISAGQVKDATGKRIKRRQFRLKLAIPESYGTPAARRALAVNRLIDIVAMRDALVSVGRGAQAEYLMRKAGAVCDDEEKFALAIAHANVAMTRPSEKASEAATRFGTWGLLARAWCSQELARLYPNAGYAKKTAEDTDEPRVEFICKYIENVPLASFNDDDYWRAMRPARAHCRTDSTFKAYSQVCRRVLKIAVELKIIPVWPLSAVCKLPKVDKGSSPEFPFLYPEEYVRLVRCEAIRFEYRVLWGFIIREGLRISEAFRIRWEHLSQLPNGRWLLDVPDTKTGRALNFVLNLGTGEVLAELRRRMPELAGPFAWLKATNIDKAAADLRKHIEQSGTTRERLLYTNGRLRRVREHDLRSTFVTWCKLAGVDNETISTHTGHESSTMIKRYNRSKATIEHLGLPPYLPLDQAFGHLARELGPERPRQLGAGEPTARQLGAATGLPEWCWPGFPSEAPGVTSALQGEAPGSVPGDEAAWRPCCGRCGAPMPSGPGAYTGRCAACGEAWDGSEQRPGSGSPAPSPARQRASFEVGKEEPLSVLSRAGEGTKALNSWSGCDASRDARPGASCQPMPENEKSWGFDAGCARGDSNPHAFRRWNLNPCPSDGNEQNPEESGAGPAPEGTRNDRASRPPVTLLGHYEAAARQALADHNWAALQALQPLIDAEARRARDAEPAEPVRLEVVRAERGERGRR